MNIKDILRWIGEQCGVGEEVIQEAFNYANASAGQGSDIQEEINRELTEDEVVAWKTYGLIVIRSCLVDSEFRKKFMEMCKERTIDKN